MNYIEVLVVLKKDLSWLDYRRQRRAILLMHEPRWDGYFEYLSELSDEALEGFSVEHGYQEFRDHVWGRWELPEMWKLVAPLDQQDWRWLRMQVMRERYTTLNELSAVYGVRAYWVEKAVGKCGYEPVFVGSGTTNFKVRYWDRKYTNAVDIWRSVNSNRFADEERRLAEGYVHVI